MSNERFVGSKIAVNTEYDVIVVGGRVAGSHLAARLAKYGFTVLLLERATFPSLPAVSSPIIYSSTMRLLDEIGADESAYARNTPKLYRMKNITRSVSGDLPIPPYKGRDYAYAIDRARFDATLWDTAMAYDGVDGRQGFSVTDLLWDGDTVVGVTGKEKNAPEEAFRARAVVGADGRFGLVGRKANASEVDKHEAHPTSIYYAYWTGVTQVDNEPSAAAYEGNYGYGYLTMDSADGQTVIAIEGRADVVAPDAGQIDEFYLNMLDRHPLIAERITGAEMVTTIRGMRNIGNSYRQPGGRGWALVGDAYHQKDPLDGQGIYNAVITGKALARQMLRWHKGEISWEDALKEYDQVARIKTYSMYKSLQSRIRTSFYGTEDGVPIPEQLQADLGRWLLGDEAFKDLMGKMLTREVPADYVTMMSAPTMLGAIARGIRKDIRNEIKKRVPFLNRAR